jgi:hypothetical protein
MPPQPDRPVRLTFPGYDTGAARIMAGNLQVGTVLGEFWCWRAYLWPVADDFAGQLTAEQVTGKRLADVRETLRRRAAESGPWWKAEGVRCLSPPERSETAATGERAAADARS